MSDQYDSQSAPEPAPAPAPVKAKRTGVKMSDAQKTSLTKHMEKLKKNGMTASEAKSHRMSIMARMRKGMTVQKAHKDLMKSKS